MAKMVSNCAIFDTESLAISDSLKSTLGGAIMEKMNGRKLLKITFGLKLRSDMFVIEPFLDMKKIKKLLD